MSFAYYLLYPPKLREEIERLRLSDELDLEVFKRVEKECPPLLLMSSSSLLIIPMFLYFDVSWPEIFVWLLIYLAAMILPAFELTYKLWRFSYPFCFGHVTQGEILERKTFASRYAYFWRIKYKYNVSGKTYFKTIRYIPGEGCDKNLVSAGEKIKVYYMEDNPKFSAPYLARLTDCFDFKRRCPNKGATQ